MLTSKDKSFCRKKIVELLHKINQASDELEEQSQITNLVMWQLYLNGRLYLSKEFVRDICYLKGIDRKRFRVTEASELLTSLKLGGRANHFRYEFYDGVAGWWGSISFKTYCKGLSPSGMAQNWPAHYGVSVFYYSCCNNLFLYKDDDGKYQPLDWRSAKALLDKGI